MDGKKPLGFCPGGFFYAFRAVTARIFSWVWRLHM